MGQVFLKESFCSFLLTYFKINAQIKSQSLATQAVQLPTVLLAGAQDVLRASTQSVLCPRGKFDFYDCQPAVVEVNGPTKKKKERASSFRSSAMKQLTLSYWSFLNETWMQDRSVWPGGTSTAEKKGKQASVG